MIIMDKGVTARYRLGQTNAMFVDSGLSLSLAVLRTYAPVVEDFPTRQGVAVDLFGFSKYIMSCVNKPALPI